MILLLLLFSLKVHSIYYALLLTLSLILISVLRVFNFSFKRELKFTIFATIVMLSFYSSLFSQSSHSLESIGKGDRVYAVVLADSNIKSNGKTTKIQVTKYYKRNGSYFSCNKNYVLIDHSNKPLYYKDNIRFIVTKIVDDMIFGVYVKAKNNSIYKYRKNIINFIDLRLDKIPNNYRTLLMLLICGSSRGESSFYKVFGQASSLSHVMAVSGLHLHLIIVSLTMILMFFPNKKFIITIFILFYVYLVTPKVSILRSALLYLIITNLGFSFNFSLNIALLIQLMLFNSSSINIATSLSYGSVYMLVNISKYIKAVLKKIPLPNIIITSFASSITCSIFSMLVLLVQGYTYNTSSIFFTFILILLLPILFLFTIILIITNSFIISDIVTELCLYFRHILLVATNYSIPYYYSFIIYLLVLIVLIYNKLKSSKDTNNLLEVLKIE